MNKTENGYTLYHAEEHLVCPNYEKGEKSSVEIQRLEQETILTISAPTNEIVYVLQGTIVIGKGKDSNFTAGEGNMFFIPKDKKGIVWPQGGDAEILVIRFYEGMRFCDMHRIEDLCQYSGSENKRMEEILIPEYIVMNANGIVKNYMDTLALCYRLGLRCINYNRHKISELFYLLLAFHRRETLYHFFHEAVNGDFEFSQQVRQKHKFTMSTSELASSIGYTVSGFGKRFLRIFGETPYHWMKRRKTEALRRELVYGKKNNKELCDEFGFQSVSELSHFVRRELGQTTKEIRKKL